MKDFCISEILKESIVFNNKLIDIGDYELQNISAFEQLFDNENKINLLITPDKKEILALIVLAIKLYIKNLNNEENNILNFISKGDILIYEGKKVQFIEICEMYGQKKITLKYKRGDTTSINVEDQYKLSIYNGNSKNLSTMSDKKSKKINSKHILAKILGIEAHNFNSIIREQMVVVYPSKSKLEELLESIKIKVKNKIYCFTEVFPCRYYSSIDNYTDFKGNKLKQKEILIFTSNISVARDLIQENKERSNLLLLGQDTYVNEIGGELDFLLSRKKLKKVYVLNTFDKCDYAKQLLECGFDIKVNAWTKTAFFSKMDGLYLKIIGVKNKKVHAFLSRKIYTYSIEEIDLTTNLLVLRSKLLEVLKDDFYFNKQDIFLKISYGLMKIFEKISVPIKEYDEFILNNNLSKNNVTKLINNLNCIVEENKAYEYNYKILRSILELIKHINSLLYYENPKLNYIKSLGVSYGDLIVCNSDIEKHILQNYKFIQEKYILVSSIRKYDFQDKVFKRIIFTGTYSNKSINQLYCLNGYNIINLIYPSEVYKYNSKVSKYNDFLKVIEENNDIGNPNNVDSLNMIKLDYSKFIRREDNIQIISDEDINNSEIKIEERVYNKKESSIYEKELNYDLNIDDFLNVDYLLNKEDIKKYSIYEQSEGGEVKKFIEFEDKDCALLTEFYGAKCIDKNSNTILKKNISLLEIGDKLVFIDEKTEDEIAELFHKIMYSEEFKNKFYKHYCNVIYWKKILKNYVDRYCEGYSLIKTELLLHGIKKTEQAIRSWVVNENIIGPREEEVYKALADIINDNKFSIRWKDIYNSCELIRKLKTRLRKNFNYMIVESVINKKLEGTFENIVYDVLGDLKQYAQIKEIDRIKDVSLSVPINNTNCVLDKNKVMEFLK